jgi:hypothetical protein
MVVVIAAGAFANHFKFIFNTSCLTVTPPYSTMTDFLPMAPISIAEVSWAIKHLKPSTCGGLDDIPSFINKGSGIFIPLLTYIFNCSITSETFLSLWKQTAAVPVFREGSKQYCS